MTGAYSWPALVLACDLPLDKDGQPLIVSPSQHCKRRHAVGAPPHESLLVLVVLQALRRRLIGARDLIIDSAPLLAWKRGDPDAAYGHAPAHHPPFRTLLANATANRREIMQQPDIANPDAMLTWQSWIDVFCHEESG
jgi:hypothetical protein